MLIVKEVYKNQKEEERAKALSSILLRILKNRQRMKAV